jgi:hypothetical protein
MAGFCIAYGVQPSEYMGLTRLERQAFHDQAEQIQNQIRRR